MAMRKYSKNAFWSALVDLGVSEKQRYYEVAHCVTSQGFCSFIITVCLRTL
jgi:hypothetical protein